MVYVKAHLESTASSASNAGLPRGALQKGALIEVSGAPGAGKTECLLELLSQLHSERPEARIAWVESEMTAYPCAFLQWGVSLKQVLFVECSDAHEALWSAHQILRSQAVDVLVLGERVLEFLAKEPSTRDTNLRRLQLAAEKSQASVVLLSSSVTTGAWAISVQIEVSRGSGLKEWVPRLLKHREAIPADRLMKWAGVSWKRPF